MKKIQSINPFNQQTVGTHTVYDQQTISEKLQIAQKTFLQWRKTSFAHRSKLTEKLGDVLLKNKEEYAKMITLEMGKPISQAIAEIEKCAWLCRYYAQSAEEHLSPENIKTEALKSYVSYEPLGVVFAIMPWNYPFWQVFRFAVPSLMAGNVGVLKHASNVFGCAQLIETSFKETGFPEGCFTSLSITSNQVASVIKNPVIKAVTLTGSEKAGAQVAKIAGSQIKKTVLELGGSNAQIVLPDCDLEKTIQTCIQARFQNTGQSCIAGKRLLIAASIYNKFIEKLCKNIALLQSGNPLNKDTYIGVLAREDLAITLENQLQKSVKMGAKVVLGGRRVGAFFEPTVLTDVTPEMPVFKQETFGPLLAVTTFETLEEAIALSNFSKYGLGVSIFTKNIAHIMPYIPQFDEGAVFINELVKSDPRLPFGGIKQSGYGRELGKQGIRAFVNIKTVYINT
jgi:succinate-semialdehyde dehydrogenase/glutarate-semialdehyde dehydrogenase